MNLTAKLVLENTHKLTMSHSKKACSEPDEHYMYLFIIFRADQLQLSITGITIEGNNNTIYRIGMLNSNDTCTCILDTLDSEL